MIKSFKFFVVLVAAFSLNFGVVELAEAKRLGGGGSFGSKFSQNNAIKKKSDNKAQAAAPSKAQTKNAALKKDLASKGGMMGLLGGLALGGILGAMFFGGAFEGINFLDIALLALVGFLIYKFLFAKRGSPQTARPAVAGGGHYEEANNTDISAYRQTPPDSDFGSERTSPHAVPEEHTLAVDDLRGPIPKGFDQDAFLTGAKSCYERLQAAWDAGELADLREFTSDHVFAVLQEQHRAKPQASHTEILSLDAELLKVEELGSKSEATVLFKAHLRENGVEASVTEVWHFTRPSTSIKPTWFVDGIQQVED